MNGNEDRTEAEQGNRSDQKAGNGVQPGAVIFLESEIAPAPYSQPVQKRPQECDCDHQEGAMEVAFEIDPVQPWHDTVDDQDLPEPIDWRRNQSAQDDYRGEIEQESGRVFQGC